MGEDRSWDFDAVIGIGGISSEPKRHGIAGKLTWIGIDPHKFGDARRPQVIFDHFLYFEDGPELEDNYPALASHMYEINRRHIIHEPSLTGRRALDRDVTAILDLAKNAPPSRALAGREVQKNRSQCRPQPVRPAVCSTSRRPRKCE
jgi:hypothetical protein